jgi:hypothetical protein
MAPEAVDPGIASGFHAADQQSYLQQVLQNTKASQANEQRLQMQKDRAEATVPTAGLHSAAAAFGTPNPDGTTSFPNVNVLNHALTQGEAARGRENSLSVQKNLSDNLLKSSIAQGKPIDAKHPIYPIIQAAQGSTPLPPEMLKTLADYGKRVASQAPGGQGVGEYGEDVGAQTPYPGGGAAPAPIPNGTREYHHDQTTGKTTIIDKEEPVAQRTARAALLDKGWKQDDPGFSQALYTMTMRLTPVQEGGFAVSRGDTIPEPPAPRATPPAAVPAPGSPAPLAGGITRTTGGSMIGPPKPADPAQVKEAHGADSVLAGIAQLRKYIDDPEVAQFRGDQGLLKQVLSRGAAKVQDVTDIKTLTPNVNAARAALSEYQAEFRKGMYGVRVTQQETAIIKALIASDIHDPALPQKLAEVERVMQNHRAEINANLKAARRQAIPQVTTPDNTPPSARQPASPSVGTSGAGSLTPADEAALARYGIKRR